MNKNIKFITALKFLLKKIVTLPILIKIFSKYPRIAKYLQYIHISIICITILNFILKYIFSLDLGLLDRLGFTIFLSQMFGKLTAYYKTIFDFLKDRIDFSTPEISKPVKSEVSKTPDWDYEFFKKRKDFYEKLEAIKTQLSEGKQISKDEVSKLLKSGVELSQGDKELLQKQLETKRWYSTVTDHPILSAAVAMSLITIAIYLQSGGSVDDAKNAFVGFFSGLTAYITSYTKSAEVPLNKNSSTDNDIELKDIRTEDSNQMDEDLKSNLSNSLADLCKKHRLESEELLYLQNCLNQPMTSENGEQLQKQLQKTIEKIEDLEKQRNSIVMTIQEMFSNFPTDKNKAFLNSSLEYINSKWINIDLDMLKNYFPKTIVQDIEIKNSAPANIIPESDDTKMWSEHASEIRSNSSVASTRAQTPDVASEEVNNPKSHTSELPDETDKIAKPLSSYSEEGLSSILKLYQNLGYLTEYQVLEIEQTKAYHDKTVDEVLKIFLSPEYEFYREQAYPYLKHLPEEDLEEIKNQNKTPIPTPKPNPVELPNEVTDPFSDLASDLYNSATSSQQSESSSESEAEEDDETSIQTDFEATSDENLKSYSKEDLIYIYKDFKSSKYEVPSRLIDVMIEKGIDLKNIDNPYPLDTNSVFKGGIFASLLSYFKANNKESESKIKTMQIYSPARFTILSSNEICKHDLSDMQLLREMNTQHILQNLTYEEMSYYEKLFELIEEDVPYPLYEAILSSKYKL
jgi:hypothetical protein